MPRTSASKVVIKEHVYEELLEKYLQLLGRLKNSFIVSHEKEFSELVNFSTNKELPRHRWFEYKEGYSSQLIDLLLKRENPSKEHYVLDPFTGVGTTNLVSQKHHYKSIGIDINPVATLAARVKTTHYSEQDIAVIRETIDKFSPKTTSHKPNWKILDRCYSKEELEQLMKIKGFYEDIFNSKIRDFFHLAYLSIVEDVSDRIKDGNGLKIVKSKRKVVDVYAYYIERCNRMYQDVLDKNHITGSILINGTLLDSGVQDKMQGKKIGMVVFSPPYANCFDYFEVYKLEMWMGGFVNSYSDFKIYREQAIRSHVNSKFDHHIKHSNDSVDIIAGIISCFNLWNKNIPDMLRGYFDDMTEIMKILHEMMITGSKCFIVVANSGYKGVLVPTDLLLAEIAEKIGFNVKKLIYARKMRASSQQMEELHDNYDELMRESIIELEKK